MAKHKKAYDSQNQYFTPVSVQRERTDKLLQKAAEKIKSKVDLDLAQEVSDSINSYRTGKTLSSFENVAPHIKVATEKSMPKEHPVYVKFKRMDVLPNFEELREFMAKEETIERIKKIKEINPAASFPNESDVYSTIVLELEAGKRPIYDSNGNPSNRLARDFDRFYQNQVSTVEQLEGLLEFHEKQFALLDKAYGNSKKIQEKYKSVGEFSSDFYALFRQAQAKDKSKYDSSTLLMTMTAGNTDYIYGNVDDKETTVKRILEMYEKHESEFGKMRPEIAQSEIVKKAPRKASTVETIMPGEKVKSRHSKDKDWYETLDSDVDKDELIGYTPKSKKEYGEISEMFGTFGDIKKAKDIMKETKNRGDLKYAEAVGISVIKKPSLIAYKAVKTAMDTIPGFNEFKDSHISELIEIFNKLREGEEDG